MSIITSNLFQFFRNVGRLVGINSFLANFLYGKEYEKKYDLLFQKMIQKGDCVWDIGANIGYYTRIFSDCVGESGLVYAFEPSPINFKKLDKNCKDLKNVRLYNFGISNKKSNVFFQQGNDNLGATSRIIEDIIEDQKTEFIPIQINYIDDLLLNEVFKVPKLLKIDVEGYELEVLNGMKRSLLNTNISVIGIEIHFGILHERGLVNAPSQIIQMLKHHGFKIKWSDSSHIIAIRNR